MKNIHIKSVYQKQFCFNRKYKILYEKFSSYNVKKKGKFKIKHFN